MILKILNGHNRSVSSYGSAHFLNSNGVERRSQAPLKNLDILSDSVHGSRSLFSKYFLAFGAIKKTLFSKP